ncbi:hypothetical protein HNV08_01935 [Winogradskyella eckloniae]|uniref:HD domain-containing protein n=1 Tax=Winogradskyella eckloniae TaxID=1089306 RepID=UPI0015633D19|nr:hypothetical protein [Winogradskyella eckloniae]NRD18793.1 hypothetical protein [Winogradskyella eckloniae]
MSTKAHEVQCSKTNDNAVLLDLDLSILGTDWATYNVYLKKIRQEYKNYPNIIYNSGRKKILQQFLKRDRLYLTEQFKTQFEKQARSNLTKEIEML